MQKFQTFLITLIALGVISIALCASGVRTASSVAAQGASVLLEPPEQLLTFFYKDPRPERLAGFFERFESSPASTNWEAYPPMVGFFAAVFRAYPDQVERLLPVRLNPRSAATIAAALNLSGNGSVAAKLQSKFDQAGSDETLKAELADLPTRLDELRVKTASHLDIMWGAAFASGDDRFVLVIANLFAHTANRSEQVAIDVTKTVLALTGGPKEILRELRGKYGDAVAMEIVLAATALWALQSNATRHPFVEHLVAKYGEDHAGTPAARVLSAFRLKGK
jgi:hypothetical protein